MSSRNLLTLTPKDSTYSSGYVGLVNQGNTCYMNASLQQFFMNPMFRDALLRAHLPSHGGKGTESQNSQGEEERGNNANGKGDVEKTVGTNASADHGSEGDSKVTTLRMLQLVPAHLQDATFFGYNPSGFVRFAKTLDWSTMSFLNDAAAFVMKICSALRRCCKVLHIRIF